jgi:hypothetical protein
LTDSSILPPRPVRPIVVLVEEIIHVAPYFYCQDSTCPCKTDPVLIAVLIAMLDANEVTWEEAIDIYQGRGKQS